MKKMTSAILGLSLTLATAGLTFAAQDAKPADANGSAPATTTTTTKKHVKKHKKAANQTAAPAATQNPAK
jgi:hypothetical protein